MEPFFVLLFLFSLYVVSLSSYLLFHSIVEMISIVVIASVFLIAWNSRERLKNSYLLFLGISYLFVAIIGFLHLISYKGMGVFTGHGADLPTQFWIAARYIESISLLLAPFMLGRTLKVHRLFTVYFIVTSLFVASIFSGYFPVCFDYVGGLTHFKIISEYIICLILFAALFALSRHKKAFNEQVYILLSGAIILSIFAELFFTFYIDVYGFSNLIGHYFKLLSFYLIYKAIVVTGLMKPYALLYRELKIREYDLVKEKELHEDLLQTLGLANKIIRHDILNDLNIIYLAVENLRDRMDEKELDMSLNAVEHSLKVIKEMKDFESLTSIKDLSTFDLRQLVVEVSQGSPLIVNVHGKCSVRADSGLYSVISNIFQNAVLHGKADRIEASMEEKNGPCELRISDNGIGIPDSIKERVFEEGFKYGESGNTGLGLYIAKRIVERYGEISLEDNIPSGTTFILKFHVDECMYDDN